MEQDLETLTAKVESLEKQLKASEDEHDKKDARASRKASIKKAMEHMDDEKKASYIATLKSSEDEDEKKIASELEDEHKKDSKTKKGSEHEKKEDASEHEKKELESKVAKLQATINQYEGAESAKIIDSLVTLKAKHVPNFDEKSYRTALAAKEFTELSAMYNDRKDEIITLKATEQPGQNLPHFAFTASSTQASESLETIMGERS